MAKRRSDKFSEIKGQIDNAQDPETQKKLELELAQEELSAKEDRLEARWSKSLGINTRGAQRANGNGNGQNYGRR